MKTKEQSQRAQKRAKILANASRHARNEAWKNMRSMVCGADNHERCKATPDRCLCECHD